MEQSKETYTAFAGYVCLGAGALDEVVRAAKARLAAGEEARVVVYEDLTGRVVELDLRGSAEEALAQHARAMKAMAPEPPPPPGDDAERRGPGRPKLGVVSREVSLLPRHWDWLGEQPGGASVTLRKLVEAARHAARAGEAAREAREALHRFLWDLAGNLPEFEEVARALHRGEWERLTSLLTAWPPDVGAYVQRFVARAASA